MSEFERCTGGGHTWLQNDKWCECGDRINPAWRPFLARMRSKIKFWLLQRRIDRYERHNFRTTP